MYAKRVQLLNYGPIDHLDITLPFEGDTPKPVLLVGENGSGKSIFLSHIVNGLLSAKGIAFPETPEVETGKVYKLRSNSYVKSGSQFYFGRVDFEDNLFLSEIRSQSRRKEYETLPSGPSGPDIHDAWNNLKPEENDYFHSSFTPNNKDKVASIFFEKCVLYFPPNRFEEPAWLNEDNLKARAQYMDLKLMQGQTDRRVINYSPLQENQNWLFDLLYDRAVFELQTRNLDFPVANGSDRFPLPVLLGYSGAANSTYEIALQIVRNIMRNPHVRFGIGRRNNRAVSIMQEGAPNARRLVPNIFQLSSGETSLLNLFLSILRDSDLCGTPFSQAADVRGIVVVDEIDLHLHAVHQNEVLPNLMQMFPNVQFVVTTHSSLFVLGMQRVFGEDGFALYRLPQGQRISPEEFSEFGDAYQAFTETLRFSNDMREAIEGAQKPIVFTEGTTDLRYIEKASELLDREALLEFVELRDGKGSGNLSKIWKDSLLPLTETLRQKVLLLFDCDTARVPDRKGKLWQRTIPLQAQNPIGKGIENLFSKATLEMARRHKPAFFITEEEHGGTDGQGQPIVIPEKWTVNDSEKANLCDWLCENGTPEDFQHFHPIFDLIEETLDPKPPTIVCAQPEGTP